MRPRLTHFWQASKVTLLSTKFEDHQGRVFHTPFPPLFPEVCNLHILYFNDFLEFMSFAANHTAYFWIFIIKFNKQFLHIDLSIWNNTCESILDPVAFLSSKEGKYSQADGFFHPHQAPLWYTGKRNYYSLQRWKIKAQVQVKLSICSTLSKFKTLLNITSSGQVVGWKVTREKICKILKHFHAHWPSPPCTELKSLDNLIISVHQC